MGSLTLSTTSAWLTETTGTVSITAPTRSVGDLLLVYAAARNNSETATDPSGWLRLVDASAVGSNSTVLWGRVATNDASDNFSVDFSATSVCNGQMAVFSGNVYSPLSGIVAHSIGNDTDTEATGLSYEGLTITTDNCLVLLVGKKTKTATSNGVTLSTPAGFTRIGFRAADGSMPVMVWEYAQQTTATSIATGGWTVVGTEESNIATGFTVALRTADASSSIAPLAAAYYYGNNA
jgi:hypothetical protein